MGKRGYILIKSKGFLNENESWELIKKLENLKDVEFVSNTVGDYDFVITVETQDTIDSVAEAIKEITADFEKMVVLSENDIFIKHREIKDLNIFNSLH